MVHQFLGVMLRRDPRVADDPIDERVLAALQAPNILDEDVHDVVLVLPCLAGGMGGDQHRLQFP